MRNTASGTTQRDHLLQVCKQTGKTLEELGVDLPDEDIAVPEGGEFLWDAFWDLCFSRGNNGFTENPLSWQELHAFTTVNGVELTPFEAETLRTMDRAYLAARAELSAKQRKK